MVKEDRDLEFKYYFRKWRKFRHLTQEDLGSRAGLSAAAISQLENGKQGFDSTTLAALASALECHPGELLLCDPADPVGLWCLFKRIEDSRETAQKRIAGVIKTLLAEG